MKCPWSIEEEMEATPKNMVMCLSACRLTTEEEMLLLQLCSPDERGRLSHLVEPKGICGAVTSLATLPDKTPQ
jgi:hypothetical protein